MKSYDLQTCKAQQRNGFGTLLVRALDAIGTAWRMEKVVLTVFKGLSLIVVLKNPHLTGGGSQRKSYQIL